MFSYPLATVFIETTIYRNRSGTTEFREKVK